MSPSDRSAGNGGEGGLASTFAGSFLFGNIDPEGRLDLEGEESGEQGDSFWDDEVRQSLLMLSGRTEMLSLSRDLSLEVIQETVESGPEPTVDDEDLMDVDVDDELEGASSPLRQVGGGTLAFTSLFSLARVHRYSRLKRLRFKRKAMQGKVVVRVADDMEAFSRGDISIHRWRENQALSLAAVAAHLQQQANATKSKKLSRVQQSIAEALQAYSENPAPVPQASAPLDVSHLDARIFNAINLVNWERSIIHDDSRYTPRTHSGLVQLYTDARFPDSGLPLSAPSSRPPSRTMSLHNNVTVSALASGALPAAQAAAMMSPLNLPRRPMMGSSGSMTQMASPPVPTIPPTSPTNAMGGQAVRNLASRVINVDLEFGAWDLQVIHDEDKPTVLPNGKLTLNLNDPALIFEAVELDNRKLHRAEKLIHKRLKKLKSDAVVAKTVISNYFKPVGDRFNLSNDKFYAAGADNAVAKSAAQSKRAAAMASRLSLMHSVPALRLLPPHFKTWLDKRELRQWHRPDLFFPLKERLGFQALSKLKKLQNASSTGRSSHITIRKTKDLTIRDGAPAVIVEFSEQRPLLLQNVGMATFIYNYYRKRDANDDFSFEDGEDVGYGMVLEPSDPSPFWLAGDVAHGARQLALSNNLFRAALYRHAPFEGDFLAVRFTHKGRTSYMLREMPVVLTAGQVLPAQEIYTPHSRRLNQAARNRVQVAAYRLIQKDSQGKRMRIARLLAAFPQHSEPTLRKWLKEYCELVKGQGGAVWALKANAPRLTEDDLRMLCTPEHACLYDATQLGVQLMQDLHIEADSSAPWTLSHNFLQATENRMMLQVTTTPNDPFVFFDLHRDQREEAPRGKGNRPRATGEHLMQYKAKLAHAWRQMNATLGNGSAAVDAVPSGYFDFGGDDAMDNEDNVSESTQARRRLVITRQVLVDDQMQTQVEEITDSRVIAIYLKQQSTVAIRRKRRLLAYQASKAKRARQDSTGREQRKPRPSRPPVDVRCGACGQLGHMRTNKECPMLKLEAPVRMDGSKLTISLDSLKRVQEERSKAVRAMTFKLPSRVVVSATSSGTATPPSTPKPATQTNKTFKKVPVWQFIQQQSPDDSLRADLARFNDLLARLLGDIKAKEPQSWPFHKPVSRKQYPLYYRIITKPTDLQSIQRACTQRKFVSAQEFLERLRLMATNCLQYNGAEHPFTQTANRIVALAEQALAEQRATWQPWVDRFSQVSQPGANPTTETVDDVNVDGDQDDTDEDEGGMDEEGPE